MTSSGRKSSSESEKSASSSSHPLLWTFDGIMEKRKGDNYGSSESDRSASGRSPHPRRNSNLSVQSKGWLSRPRRRSSGSEQSKGWLSLPRRNSSSGSEQSASWLFQPALMMMRTSSNNDSFRSFDSSIHGNNSVTSETTIATFDDDSDNNDHRDDGGNDNDSLCYSTSFSRIERSIVPDDTVKEEASNNGSRWEHKSASLKNQNNNSRVANLSSPKREISNRSFASLSPRPHKKESSNKSWSSLDSTAHSNRSCVSLSPRPHKRDASNKSWFSRDSTAHGRDSTINDYTISTLDECDSDINDDSSSMYDSMRSVEYECVLKVQEGCGLNLKDEPSLTNDSYDSSPQRSNGEEDNTFTSFDDSSTITTTYHFDDQFDDDKSLCLSEIQEGNDSRWQTGSSYLPFLPSASYVGGDAAATQQSHNDTSHSHRSPTCVSEFVATPKKVRFNKVHIRDYEIIVGDNPSCTSGPPISIGWNHSETREVHVNTYENTRLRISKSCSIIPRKHREAILRGWGVSDSEMCQAVRQNIKIRAQRKQTVVNLGKVERVEEAIESARKRLKNVLMLKRSRKSSKKVKEAMMMRPTNLLLSNKNPSKSSLKSSEESSLSTELREIGQNSLLSNSTYTSSSSGDGTNIREIGQNSLLSNSTYTSSSSDGANMHEQGHHLLLSNSTSSSSDGVNNASCSSRWETTAENEMKQESKPNSPTRTSSFELLNRKRDEMMRRGRGILPPPVASSRSVGTVHLIDGPPLVPQRSNRNFEDNNSSSGSSNNNNNNIELFNRSYNKNISARSIKQPNPLSQNSKSGIQYGSILS